MRSGPNLLCEIYTVIYYVLRIKYLFELVRTLYFIRVIKMETKDDHCHSLEVIATSLPAGRRNDDTMKTEVNTHKINLHSV